MAATIDDEGVAREREDEEVVEAADGESAEEAADGGEHFAHASLPWIGALANPRLGPMFVLNGGGYLVPLFTAGDLARGCRSLWRRGQG